MLRQSRFVNGHFRSVFLGLSPGDEVTGKPGESVLPTPFKAFRYTELNNCASSSTSARLSPKKKKPLKNKVKEVVNYRIFRMICKTSS